MMTPEENEARRLLSDLGFTGLKFTGETLLGPDRLLLYSRTDGSPVPDAPGVLVSNGRVRLVEWTQVVFGEPTHTSPR